jgi:hypothetical protein
MSAIVNELTELSLKMQNERPTDMDAMRKRMGARDQNASIAIYAYMDIWGTADLLFQLEKSSLKGNYDLQTVVNVACDWLFSIADRIPRYYRFNNTAELITKTIEALRTAETREEANEILHAIQHYISQLRFWIDLDLPWPEFGVAYAKAMGDPEPSYVI